MKKLFNSRFLFILASSLVVLILLTVGAFYLFDDKDNTFIKSGYVLNPLSSTSEKYFFNENVGYKENLSSMIEFVDVDEKTVSILKDSFVHYDDESLSFLKKGAILDLDSVSGDKAVSFYNITNESIIEKKNGGYVIESTVGDISLKNFIGRISDNKYIVVGDLSLKMAGNATAVKGEYFEIVYVEEGIVNIENKNVKYQVAAADTYITVGNKTIDLGDKKITVNGEDLMSITAITINGDENIEIIPKGNEDEEEEPTGSGDGLGNGTGDGTGNNPSGVGDGDTSGTGAGNENGNDGNGGTGEGNVDGEEIKEVVITLKSADVGSTNIDVVFDIVNAKEDDSFKLQVVNLSSGRTVDISTVQVVADSKISVNLLTPNTKYLFMVINEKDNGKYFQKVLETTGFGIKLEKKYATDSSLVYNVVIDEGTDITNARLSLYKFNEETKQNEIVTTIYKDPVTKEEIVQEKIVNLSELGEKLEGEHEIAFTGLDSNTIYTAVLDDFSVQSSNFKDIYNIALTSMTLKQIPRFNEMTITKNVGAGSFDLSLGNIVDPDNAIQSYTYMIYDKLGDKLAVEPIVQKNASPITVKVGNGENQLKNNTNYYYKVIIEYFDNEKYIEYITSDSIIFMMGDDPYVTVVPLEDKITHDSLAATIYLTDNSCLVTMPGRENCNGNSTTVVEVSKVNPLTGETTPVYTKLVDFEVSEEEIKYDLNVTGLLPGTTYVVEVRSNLNNTDSLEKQSILHTEESKRAITTKSLSSFDIKWENQAPDDQHVVYTLTQFTPGKNDNSALSPEESIKTVDKVVLRLYEGRNNGDLDTKLPIATKTLYSSGTFNMKEKFFDAAYPITSDGTFSLSKEALMAISSTKALNEYYTVTIQAYTATNTEVTLVNNILTYYIPSYLRVDLSKPILEVDEISNNAAGKIFGNLSNSGTTVGYKITAAFDRAGYVSAGYEPKKFNFYVYNNNPEKKEPIKFYIKNENGELELVDKLSVSLGEEDNYYEAMIYMDYGTAYEQVDDIMRRGNSFYIGYDIECFDKMNGGTEFLPNDEETRVQSPPGYGIYKLQKSTKETPNIRMYIASTTANSVTYSYMIDDPDISIYKDADNEKYAFFGVVNSGREIKYELDKVEDVDYNKFEGKIVIEGLRAGDFYRLYYRKNQTKTGNFTSDVFEYFDGYSSGVRMFDGYYNAKQNISGYNFRYEIINNPLRDNKVVFKILANEDILKRILSYKISFKDSKDNVLNKELWKLSVCDGDVETATPRCLSVDYTELKEAGMKSEGNETNLINATITAVYDNGLTGYDFKVGPSNDDDYLYCIMQTNSSEYGMGNYISFSSTGAQVAVWTEDLNAPKGYYTYTLNKSIIFYKSQLNLNHRKNISVSLGSSGYSSQNGFLNPKMVSVDEMACTGASCSGFSFNSITPKVLVSQKAPLINGSVMNFTLSGIDIVDLKMESDGERYLYIDTWEKRNDAGNKDLIVRPTLKVKIDSAHPTATVSGIIDGLKEYSNAVGAATGTYYFNVYAYLNKDNKYVYTQLFDASISDKYAVKTYEFNSAKPNDLFHNMEVNFSVSETNYGDRTLNSKFNLLPYKNNISFNFELIYVLCEEGAECDLEHNIFKKKIESGALSTVIDDSYDISSENLGINLEYNKKYKLYLYASSDYYESPSNSGKGKREVLINRWKSDIVLRSLNEPSFVVTRNALIDGDDYIIDFDIVVNDPDRTLVGKAENPNDKGKYFIKLLNQAGEIVGNMQLQDENGVYTDVSNYHEYGFDAFVVNKKVRIRGLEPDSKYTFIVYSDAFINNYSVDTEDEDPEIEKANRTYEIAKSYTVYSTNDYGVAFGKDITYSATEKSIIVTFLGGSNFDNVVKVFYTVGLWDDETDSSVTSGEFVIGENNKRFELYRGTEDWRFVIDPKGMTNTLGKTYTVSISFEVKIPGTNKTITLTSADVPGFEGRAIYVLDE